MGRNGQCEKGGHRAYTQRTQAVHTAYIRTLLFGALQHTKKVTRIVGIGDHIKLIKEGCFFDFPVDVTQGREIFDCEADAVEKGDVTWCGAALFVARQDFPKLCHGVMGVHLLNFAFNAGLGRVFDKNIGAGDDIAM